jgi:hypothetical protein
MSVTKNTKRLLLLNKDDERNNKRLKQEVEEKEKCDYADPPPWNQNDIQLMSDHDKAIYKSCVKQVVNCLMLKVKIMNKQELNRIEINQENVRFIFCFNSETPGLYNIHLNLYHLIVGKIDLTQTNEPELFHFLNLMRTYSKKHLTSEFLRIYYYRPSASPKDIDWSFD